MRRTIRIRLIVSLLPGLMLLFFLFVLYVNGQVAKVSREQSEFQVNAIGETAARVLQAPLYNADYASIKNIMEPLVSEEFDYFYVVDTQINSLAYSQERDASHFLPIWQRLQKKPVGKAPGVARIFLEGEPFREYTFPVLAGQENAPLGLLVVGISENRIHNRLIGIARWLTLVGLVTLLLMSLIVSYVAYRFSLPLRDLSRTMEEFSAGRYEVRSNLKTGDEVQRLSESFNAMAGKLNEQIRSVEHYSQSLERMVGERTEKLKEAMEELRIQEKRLEKANKMRSLTSLVTSVAHEINNPLTVISWQIERIALSNNDEALAKRLKPAQEAVERIVSLIRDIAFFSSLKDLEPMECNLVKLTGEIVEGLGTPGVEIHFQGSEETPLIYGNPMLIERALRNVLQNALDALSEKAEGSKKITVQVWGERDGAIVEVTDNGSGVPEPERAFEPFYTTSPQKRGLGLTFVYHILQLHNGRAELENLPSEGCRVRLLWPARGETLDT